MGLNIYCVMYSAIILLYNLEDTNAYRFIQYRRQIIPYPSITSLLLKPETDPFSTSINHLGLKTSLPINNEDPEALKAYSCSLLICQSQDDTGPVCACNFNTGNVVSFKNQCDVLKHNCRFDTGFKVILNEICPWEFQSRRDNSKVEFNYNDPKYYN